jgi:hypothetical protein
MTLSSATPFYSYLWTAHDIQVFAPGSYSFDTTLGGGNPEIGILNMTVPTGQLGIHLLFDWNGNLNVDIAMVMQRNAVFGSGKGFDADPVDCGTILNPAPSSNCLWDGATYGPAGVPAGNTTWLLASVDGDGDDIMGIPMAPGGPYAGFNFSFNVQPVPLPPAVIPFGSGLLGLLGIIRKRKPA